MRVVLVGSSEKDICTLENQLHEFDEIEVVETYREHNRLLEDLKKINPEVVWIKMESEPFAEIELARRLHVLENSLCIVFIAESPLHAVKAFEVEAVDYLLEPVQQQRLEQTVRRLRNEIIKRKLFSEKDVEKGQKERYEKNKGECKEKVPCVEKKLHVYSLGRFYVTDTYGQQIKWRTKKVKEMFAFFWHNRKKSICKSVIMEELWPEYPYDKANSLFHTTMYQLRRSLKELGFEEAIQFHNDDYKFMIPCTSDLEEVKEYLHMEESTKASIYQIFRLCVGDYFEEEGYHWVGYKQLNYRKKVIKYLERFVDKWWAICPEDEIIETCLNRMLLMDEGNEDYMYTLLKWYKLKKNTVTFMLKYNKYESFMREEFGLEIPDKILQLYYDFITNSLN